MCGSGNRKALPEALVAGEVTGGAHWEPGAQGFWNCSLSQSFLRLDVGSGGHSACALDYLSPHLAYGCCTHGLGLGVHWSLGP